MKVVALVMEPWFWVREEGGWMTAALSWYVGERQRAGC